LECGRWKKAERIEQRARGRGQGKEAGRLGSWEAQKVGVDEFGSWNAEVGVDECGSGNAEGGKRAKSRGQRAEERSWEVGKLEMLKPSAACIVDVFGGCRLGRCKLFSWVQF
jgi:hypothetical protein